MTSSMIVLPADGTPTGLISVQFQEADLQSQSVSGVGGPDVAPFTLGAQAAPYGARVVALSIGSNSAAWFEHNFSCPLGAGNREVQSGSSQFLLYNFTLQWDGKNGLICGQWSARLPMAAPSNLKARA